MPLTEQLNNVGRSNAPEHRESLQPSSGHPPSTQATHAALAPAEHANALWASRDTVDALQRENASLRAETSAMRAQIAQILNRLNAFGPSQGTYHCPHVPSYYSTLISLDSQHRKDSNVTLNGLS